MLWYPQPSLKPRASEWTAGTPKTQWFWFKEQDAQQECRNLSLSLPLPLSATATAKKILPKTPKQEIFLFDWRSCTSCLFFFPVLFCFLCSWPSEPDHEPSYRKYPVELVKLCPRFLAGGSVKNIPENPKCQTDCRGGWKEILKVVLHSWANS